jgi:hypothetical protein
MLDFRDQDLDDFKTDKEVQDAILMGLRYKEAYEKLLWEKNVLISCLCSGKFDVIGIDNHEGNTTYHVRVKSLDDEQEATWGIDDGQLALNYSCHSPYAAVLWMLNQMKKWEDENGN